MLAVEFGQEGWIEAETGDEGGFVQLVISCRKRKWE